MKTYLVGGAVRDRLLNHDVTERDFVVVGETPEAMLRRGFKQVGRDFPVFLHPDTGEEYALARTERKVGPGHQGFVFHASTDVSLKDDLIRRDLTINAMAEDADGQLIDPYGGQADLEARQLRHVSDAFAEDPLRVLRLARFLAKLAPLGFTVADETLALIRQMVEAEALAELSPERILGELNKALHTPEPAAFFKLLAEVGAGQRLWPEITPDDVNELASRKDLTDPEHRFVFLVNRLDEEDIKGLCQRLRCSNDRTDLALLVARHIKAWQVVTNILAGAKSNGEIAAGFQTKAETDIDSSNGLDEADSGDIGFAMSVLKGTDAIRQPRRFAAFNQACAALLRAPAGASERWADLLEAAATIKRADVDPSLTGPDLGKAIETARAERLEAMLKNKKA